MVSKPGPRESIGSTTDSKHWGAMRSVRTDGSFESMPFFLISRRNAGRDSEMDFARTASYTTEEGERKHFWQKWTVRAAGSLGLPTRFDQDVYMAVHEILRERGGIPADGILQFSMYELRKWLRSFDGGKQYSDMRSSLNRIALTTIESTNAFWSARSRKYVSDSFSIWTFHFSDYRNSAKGTASDRQMLRFHPLFIENYEDNYLNDLDSEFYWSLRDHGAKRLYRLLESYALQGPSGKRSWECDLFELRDLIPLGTYSYPSKIQQVLARSHDELHNNGFLADVSVEKLGKGSYSVCYELSADFSPRRQKEVLETSPEYHPALDAMRRAGVKRGVRLDVLQKYDPDLCLELASLLPYKSGLQSPDAALRWCLKNPEKGREWLSSDPQNSVPVEIESTRGDGNSDKQDAVKIDVERGVGYSDCGSGVDLSTGDDPDDVDLVDAPDHSTAGNVEPESWGTDQDQAGPVPLEKRLADQFYQEILSEIFRDGENAATGSWFDGIYARSLRGGVLTLVAPSESARDYILRRFGDDLQHRLSESLKHREISLEAEVVVVAAGEES